MTRARARRPRRLRATARSTRRRSANAGRLRPPAARLRGPRTSGPSRTGRSEARAMTKTSMPTSRASRSASGPPRRSCHAMPRAMGSPRSSSITPVSPMLQTPIPRTSPSGAAARASSAAPMDASASACGSTSAPVGTTCAIQGVGRRPCADLAVLASPARPCRAWSRRRCPSAGPSRLSSAGPGPRPDRCCPPMYLGRSGTASA